MKLAAVLLIFVTSTASAAYEGFFRLHTGCGLLDMTSRGVAGDLIQLGHAELSLAQLKELPSQGKAIPSSEGSFAGLSLGRGYVPRKFWPDHRQVKLFENLGGFLSSMRASALDLHRLVDEADHEMSLRHQKGLSECYAISMLSRGSFLVELNSAAQKRIDDLFRDDRQMSLSRKETELFSEKRLNYDEIRELRALRRANEIFERSTMLWGDRGGWAGNFDHRDVSTTCGHETEIYFGVLRRFQQTGRLRLFRVVPGGIFRREKDDDHMAVLLENIRTKEFFAYDSWFEDGGLPARILTATDWLLKNDDDNAVEVAPLDLRR